MTLLYSYTPSGAGPTSPPPAGGTPTSQTWSNFVQGGSTGALGLLNNLITVTTVQTGGYAYTENPSNIGTTTDYRTEVTYGRVTTALAGAVARKQGTAGTLGDHYVSLTYNGISLWRNTSGTFTQLGSSTAHTWAINDKHALQVSGTGATVTLNGYINGGAGGTYTTPDITTTDTSASRIVTAGSAGWMTNDTSGTIGAAFAISGFTVNDLNTGSSYSAAGPNGATVLPANHGQSSPAGDITVTVSKTGGTFAGTEVFTVTGVTGWSKISQSVTAGASTATVVIRGPLATAGAGATGTLTLSDGTLSCTISIATPTLTLTPTSQVTNGSARQKFTGTNTLWQSDNPQFTLTGAPAGTTLGASTATTNIASSAVITTGATTGSATVTDPSTGATATVTIAAIKSGSINDTNVYFSPYNWFSDGLGTLGTNNVNSGSSYVQTNNAGAYIKVKFQGTGIILNYDNTVYGGVANNYPTVSWTVDNGPISSALLAATDSGAKSLASGLADAVHTLVLWVKNRNNNGNGSGATWDWSGANCSLKITSFTCPIAAPAAPGLSQAATGGTVAAGAYGAEVTYVTASGETAASVSASITTTGTTSTMTIASPASVTGATGWYAYVTQPGGSSYTRQQAAGSPTAIGTALTLTAPPTSTGAAAPSTGVTALPATTSAFTLQSKKMLVFGDSISEGAHAAQGDTTTGDAVSTYVIRVAEAMGCEVGFVAFGGTGWLQGAAGVPTFHTVGTAASQTWQWYSLGNSRLVSGKFSPVPDYIIVLHGTNDGLQSSADASVTSAANDFLTQMATVAPTTKLLLTLPPGRFKKTALSAATMANGNMKFVDLDATSPADQLLAFGLTNTPAGDGVSAFGVSSGASGNPSRRSGDGLHPNSLGHAELASRIIQALLSKFASTTTKSTTTFMKRTFR